MLQCLAKSASRFALLQLSLRHTIDKGCKPCGSLLVLIRRCAQAEMETWGSFTGADSLPTVSNRQGYTPVILRLRGVSDAPRQLACNNPLSAVQRGWHPERVEQRTADDNSNQAPSIASTATMPQPCSLTSQAAVFMHNIAIHLPS